MTSPDGDKPTGAYTGAAGSSNVSNLQSITQASALSVVGTGPVTAFSGAANNTGGFVKAAGDEGMAALCRAVANVDILGIEPFQFMNGWATNLDQQAQQALTTGNTALSTANSAVTSITTQQTQTTTGGNSVTVPSFPPKLTGSLGTTSVWTLSGTTGSGSQVQWKTDSNGNAGPHSLASTGNYTAFLTAVNGQVMATDAHQVTTVVGVPAASGGTAVSGVVARATANMSSFVYALASSAQILLGYGGLSGTLSATTWQTVNYTLNAGDTLQLSANGSLYTVSVNDTPVTSYNDSGVSSPVGPSNRSVGILTEQVVQTNFGGATVNQGWWMGSFNAADTIAPPVVGIGWMLSQQGTTPVALPGSGGWSTFGTGALDTKQVNPNTVTVADLGTGRVTIPVTGWYVLAVSANLDLSCGTGNFFQAGVYKTPSGGSKSLVMTGSQVCGAPIFQAACSGPVFCVAGDIVQPAVYQAGTNSTDGSGETYFSGTLCSSN